MRLCVNTADVFSNANTSYNSFAAGIVASARDTTEIAQCYNSGEISSFTQHTGSWYDTTPSASASSGGIAATVLESATVSDCYNTGKIIAQSSDAGYGGYYSSHGYAYSGGIAGQDLGAVSNCYNVGTIYTYDADYCYEGAIAGSTNDEVELKNCYYIDNVNVSATGDSKATLTNVSGCTDSQLRQQSTYINFDFSNIWFFDLASDYPYPQLQGLASAGQIPDVPPVPGDGIILALSPANGATDVGYDVSNPPVFQITFDREVASFADQPFVADVDLTMEDTFAIYRTSDDALIYKPTEYSRFCFTLDSTKNVLTITPTNNHVLLEPNTQYYVTMGEDFVRFTDGTGSPVIQRGAWEFTTCSIPLNSYHFNWMEIQSPIHSASDNLVITMTALASLGYSKFSSTYYDKTISDFVKDGKHREMVTKGIDAIWEVDGGKLGSYVQFYNDVVGDYKLFKDYDDNGNSGFYGVCFQSPDGKYIISYRGSEGDMGTGFLHLFIEKVGASSDWSTDLDFAFRNQLSRQFTHALNFYQEIESVVGKENIVLTGHSLGGALAGYVSICTGARAYSIDGAVGHILDTTFWESFETVYNFTGANNLNLINLTDETGKDFGDLIQATKVDLYPMITYASLHAKDATDLNSFEKAVAGSHHALSYLTYDETSQRYTLGKKIKVYNCNAGWSNDIVDYVPMLEKTLIGTIIAGGPIGGIIGWATSFVFDRGRVQLGTTYNDTIKAPHLFGIDSFVNNRQFGGSGNDNLIGYSSTDVLVANGTSCILDGQGGSDFYFIDSACQKVTINDPSGNDIIFLRNWDRDNIAISDVGDYVRIADSQRSIIVNKDRSIFSRNNITVLWVNEICSDEQVICTDLFAEVDRNKTSQRTFANGSETAARLVVVEGVAELSIYDSNQNLVSTVPFSNKAGDSIEYTDYAYYYGYNNLSDNTPYAVLYLFNTAYTVEVDGNARVSVALYQYDEDENTFTTGNYISDLTLEADQTVAIVSSGEDKGFYLVETDTVLPIENVVSIQYVQSISLSQRAVSMKLGSSIVLSCSTYPADAVTDGNWYSSDPNIASVDANGIVTAQNIGNAEITFIAINGKYASCSVQVESDNNSNNVDDSVWPPSSSNANTSGGTPALKTYAINIPTAIGGQVITTLTSAIRGTAVTLTAAPDSGYELATLAVMDSKGNALELIDKGNSKYTFTMPDSEVTVDATFRPIPDQNMPQTSWANPFTDIAESAWYYDAVKYVSERGLMNGIGGNLFSPESTTTRAMIWTILARLDGVDTTGGDPWYEKGQAWAIANQISDGTAPDASITREQLITMLWRYKGSPNATADLSRFTDNGTVSNWAKDAIEWAVSTGLLQGSDGKLDPTGTATRAQVAAVLQRYCETLA